MARRRGFFAEMAHQAAVAEKKRQREQAATGRELWLAASWVVWGVLWFMYFLLLALGKPILRQTAWVTLLAGIFTGWLPGWLLLDGLM